MAKRGRPLKRRTRTKLVTVFKQPMLYLFLFPLLVLFVVWLAGGLSRQIGRPTEPSSLAGVQTLPQSNVKLATPAPPALLWQGPVQPVVTDGQMPVLYRLPISQPVVFLGIDDGWVKSPDAASWLVSQRLPFTLFLTNDAIKNDYAYFQKLQSAGLSIEDHTLHHPRLNRLSFANQKTEICTTADQYASVFGQRPVLFRPPYGLLNASIVQAAQICGMKAIIMWHVDVENSVIKYQQGNHLQPGDIVLMHFHSNLSTDLQVFTNQVQKDNLQIGHLEDWIQ